MCNLLARVSAAAWCPLVRCFLLRLVCISRQLYGELWQAQCVYSRANLISIRFQNSIPITEYFQQANNIPPEIPRTPGSPWILVGSHRQRQRRRGRKQKWGCQADLTKRLKKDPQRPPLPSIFLANVGSFVLKIDDLELRIANNNFVQDFCVLILTETWLHPAIPNNTVQLGG